MNICIELYQFEVNLDTSGAGAMDFVGGISPYVMLTGFEEHQRGVRATTY
jgi:hypothetical protein